MGAFNFNDQANKQRFEKPFDFDFGDESKDTKTMDERLTDETDGGDEDYVEYTEQDFVKYETGKFRTKPISLDDYPDTYIFRTGELARYLNAKEQNIRNIMNLYLDKFIKPEVDSKGRMFTKDQVMQIEEIYHTWRDRGISWPDIEKMLTSELGSVYTAKDNLSAGKEMIDLFKSWLEEALRNHSSAMALEDKEMLVAVTEKLDSNEKAILELKENVKLQEAAMRTQSESFQEILLSQNKAAKEQAELLRQLQEQNEQLKAQNSILLEQTKPKKKKFPFFK